MVRQTGLEPAGLEQTGLEQTGRGQGWASAAPMPWARREWGAGALGAAGLHVALALAVAGVVALSRHALLEPPEMTIELDMGDVAPPPMVERKEGAGGGGAGGAIAAREPLKATAKPLAPLVPPEFIEPVPGAPVVRTEGPPPVGYGPGFGGGMGGGIGGGMGRGIGSGAGDGRDIPAPPAAPPTPVNAGAHYDAISTAIYSGLIRYPPSALRAGLEGLGVLRVVVDRTGKVLSWEIEKSTGHDVLDTEIKRVARKVHAIDSIPTLPVGYKGIVHVQIVFQMVD